jgi:hypothetical protein
MSAIAINAVPSNEVIYRKALENIYDFAHACHKNPHIEHDGHYPNGSAMEEIAICAKLALAEVP